MQTFEPVQIIQKSKNVFVFDSTTFFEEDDHYIVLYKNEILFRDQSHLSMQGSFFIAEKFLQSNAFQETYSLSLNR
jgi:hypothetical protein